MEECVSIYGVCNCDKCSDKAFIVECKKGGCEIDPHYEPVFVIGVYVNDEKEREEFWCKDCYVKAEKGVNLNV